ncbi:MAG: thymidine phosphorylase family protein [Rhodospirillaceae bacterium]|nr:thymidine phosphorylase family protein [Rhodospirillaceae bacterium]
MISIAAHKHDASANTLRLRRLGIDFGDEFAIFMRRDCHICRAEGFSARTRVEVTYSGRSLLATLVRVTSDLLADEEASLSAPARPHLGPSAGALVSVAHADPVESLSHVRAKIYGRSLDKSSVHEIIADIAAGRYSEVALSAFITAVAERALNQDEVFYLTEAMVSVGSRLDWGQGPIADKHSVGGLPGNRTTPIVVPIIAACGVRIPKTSSRAITSPAGTADTMEVLAPVDLSVADMRRVVEAEGGCIVWGGAVDLSPADDVLVRVERQLDLDSEGQLVASVLSKKIAAGSTHIVIDLPVGPTAKIRSAAMAKHLADVLELVAERAGLTLRVVESDGRQPVGRGVGPALEARDVLAVLQNDPQAPLSLRQRALSLAGPLLELVGIVGRGEGLARAEEVLRSGQAWKKFQAICASQGGMRAPPIADIRHAIVAQRRGVVANIDNRLLARIAKLAGAPSAKAAGIDVHVELGDRIEKSQPLYTIHAETRGELAYALEFLARQGDIFAVEEGP